MCAACFTTTLFYIRQVRDSKSTPLLDEKLMGRVRLEDCTWELQSADSEAQPPGWYHSKELVVTLGKAVVQHRFEGDIWAGFVEGGDTVNTRTLAIDQEHQAMKMKQLDTRAKESMRNMLPQSLKDETGVSILDKLLLR